jgi:hypothetical protein
LNKLSLYFSILFQVYHSDAGTCDKSKDFMSSIRKKKILIMLLHKLREN